MKQKDISKTHTPVITGDAEDGLIQMVPKPLFRLIDDFNNIIDLIENRCMASEGPVTPTLMEMREDELAKIWQLLQQIRKFERFTKPTRQQILELAILFNDGKIEQKKLVDMVALANLIVDRLHENGTVEMKSSKE